MPPVDGLEEGSLALPSLLTAALGANDRLKYYLTLLQSAKGRAQQPHQPVSDLRSERESCGITDPAFDAIVPASHVDARGAIWIPGAGRVRTLLAETLPVMLQPLQVAASAGIGSRARVHAFAARLDALNGQWPPCTDDRLSAAEIDALTRVGTTGTGPDSVHQWVADLHRELNHLQATVFRDSVDGAKTYGLTAADQDLVRAFMRGLHATAPLKFDHPGLGTTATRTGDRLSIQNDLGTTDAHVVVIHIRDLTATLVYTDIHPRRVRFFQDLLVPCGVAWEVSERLSGTNYVTAVGHLDAADRDVLGRYLTHLGSRLVFLIDWNRARKSLRRFVRNNDAIALLKWAADNDLGHRALLQAGDARLIYAALERAARAQLRYGARLDEILGAESAKAFLRSTLRLSAEGLKSGRSVALIQDEIEAELLSHLETTDHGLIGLAAEHAMLVTSLAERLRHTFMRVESQRSGDDVTRAAELAAAWEARANQLVARSHRWRDQAASTRELRHLLAAADRAADAIEECIHLLTLLTPEGRREIAATLAPLGSLVSRSAKEYVRCLEHARRLPRQPARPDIEAILVAGDRLVQLEGAARAGRRAAQARLARSLSDPRWLQVPWEAASRLEVAVDTLAQCGLIVRAYALREVLPGDD